MSAWLCYSIGLFYFTMLVREPVHGMQGLLERQRYEPVLSSPERGMAELRFTPTPHVSGAALTIFLGTRLGLRKRPTGRTRTV